MSIICNSHSVYTWCTNTSVWISAKMGWCSHLCFISSCPTRPIFKHERRGYGNRPFRHHHAPPAFIFNLSPKRNNTQSFCFSIKTSRLHDQIICTTSDGCISGFLGTFICFVSQCYDWCYSPILPQVAQAQNMSIGEHRHCCVTFEI